MVSYKEREKQRREAEILRMAAHLINERGYAELNMDHVAEAVGVSKPTLYQHFKSKDELVIRVMEQSGHDLEAHMASIHDLSPLAQFESILRFLLMTHIEPEAFPATLVLKPSLQEHDAYQNIVESWMRTGQRLRQIVQEGKATGEIAQDIPPDIVISGMFSLLGVLRPPEGMSHLAPPDPTRVEGIIRLFLRGICSTA